MSRLKNKIVTVFGGTGFVGRHLVAALVKEGAIVRVPSRLKNAGYALRTGAAVGQVVPMQVDFKDKKSIENCVEGADFAVNLIGVLYETPRQFFERVHIDVARDIAKAAKKAGIKHFVHMSSLGADDESGSRYLRSKSLGEQAVLKAFPTTMVLRPSIIFGEGDGFFCRFAKLARFLPVLPLIGGGKTKFQPVFVCDVIDAIMISLTEEEMNIKDMEGIIVECGGPQVYTFKELLEYTLDQIHLKRALIPLPFWFAKFKAWFWEKLPGRLLTRDQVNALKYDSVVTGKHTTIEDMGIVPTPLEVIVPEYLESYRQGGQFARYHKLG